MSKQLTEEILYTLSTIEGNGTFVTSGVHEFIAPRLEINGLGELGFPLNPIQIKAMIALAKKAPFGKGMETITDTSVRSAWEIDANQLSFHQQDWTTFLQKIMEEVKEGLGIEEKKVTASLYKLLIYETGDFFLPHKDSEKEKGMFGTLVIGLPSTHEGGKLMVRFEGQEEVIDFSTPASDYKIPYTAFFADCEHEIKPITSGYRVCLVYNLLQSRRTEKIAPPQFTSQAEAITDILKKMEKTTQDEPKIFILSHQYTPTNFSLTHLKQHDRPRAEALLLAADQAGYFAKLGLVTYYLMGELEGVGYGYRSRYGDYEEPDLSEGTMGEIYDTSLLIDKWSEDGYPGFGEMNIHEDDLLGHFDLGDGEPIQQEAEGYTGNAGMELQYWYHYGAVVLWSRKQHVNILLQKPVAVRLKWFDFYIKNWNDKKLESPSATKLLLASLKDVDWNERRYNRVNYDLSSVSTALIKLDDEKFIKENNTEFLVTIFKLIKVENWVKLLQNYTPNLFTPTFSTASQTDDISVSLHFLEVLQAVNDLKKDDLHKFVLQLLEQLPKFMSKVEFHKNSKDDYFYLRQNELTFDEKSKKTIELILALSQHKNKDKKWLKAMHQLITKHLLRSFVNNVLTPILLSKKYQDRNLGEMLYQTVAEDFINRTSIKPTPPKNWTRPFPEKVDSYYQEQFELLREFLASPTQQVFDYSKNQSIRSSMESAIRNITIDLEMTTIKRGSPHTLRITKTQAAFEKQLKHWKWDVDLLEQLKELK